MAMQPTGRLAARLAAIESAKTGLVRLDEAARDDDWNEASAFNADARSDEWRRLEDERRNTLASADPCDEHQRSYAPAGLTPSHEAMPDRMVSPAMLARHGLGSRLGA